MNTSQQLSWGNSASAARCLHGTGASLVWKPMWAHSSERHDKQGTSLPQGEWYAGSVFPRWRWFPSIPSRLFSPQKMMQTKNPEKKETFQKGYWESWFFFWKSPFFRLFLWLFFLKGSLWEAEQTTLEAMNDFARKRQDRQGFSFFQVKSGWISFSFKICFSSKDTENSHGIRWTSISAVLSRLLLNGYHQQRSCISFGYDIPWICPRGRQSPPGLFRCIPCVFSFQTGLYQKQRHQSLPFNGTGATMPWLWCANTTQWGLSQNHVCLWTCWGNSTGGQRDSKYAKLGGILLVGFFLGSCGLVLNTKIQ